MYQHSFQISLNAWLWSAVFHTRDLIWTEVFFPLLCNNFHHISSHIMQTEIYYSCNYLVITLKGYIISEMSLFFFQFWCIIIQNYALWVMNGFRPKVILIKLQCSLSPENGLLLCHIPCYVLIVWLFNEVCMSLTEMSRLDFLILEIYSYITVTYTSSINTYLK